MTRDPVSADNHVAAVCRSARALSSEVPAAASTTESFGRQPHSSS
ncbi:hypothetical protein I549_1013 [Mycobacterium avium subsp. avium 2285 (R)]|nr:hypothetical protein I549_1013 [Mycobacterium avium subsp. avium 2285 (R)]